MLTPVTYQTLNSSHANPFLFSLTERGFYSEINNLLNAILYGLVTKRRLIIDLSQFAGGDLVWSDLYSSHIPSVEDDTLEDIHPDWMVTGYSSPGFKKISTAVGRWHLIRSFFLLRSHGLYRNVFAAKRSLASQLCQPATPHAKVDSLSLPYAAIHIRRGDKIDGYTTTKGKLNIEGENISINDYLTVIRNKAHYLKCVFVMTDDYHVIDRLRSEAPDLEIVTLCQDTEQGYRQDDFNHLNGEAKGLAIRRLITEVEIASKSQIFVGCYKSNVSRYIALTHSNPCGCLSVDSRKSWHPR